MHIANSSKFEAPSSKLDPVIKSTNFKTYLFFSIGVLFLFGTCPEESHSEKSASGA